MFDDKLTPDPVMLPRGRRACRRKAEELSYVRSLHREFGAFARSLEQDAVSETPRLGQRELFKVRLLINSAKVKKHMITSAGHEFRYVTPDTVLACRAQLEVIRRYLEQKRVA